MNELSFKKWLEATAPWYTGIRAYRPTQYGALDMPQVPWMKRAALGTTRGLGAAYTQAKQDIMGTGPGYSRYGAARQEQSQLVFNVVVELEEGMSQDDMEEMAIQQVSNDPGFVKKMGTKYDIRWASARVAQMSADKKSADVEVMVPKSKEHRDKEPESQEPEAQEPQAAPPQDPQQAQAQAGQIGQSV